LNEKLHIELWTSWASLLRSYAAAHGLNAPQHAVVEVSTDAIVFRVGTHWLRFTETTVQHDEATPEQFALQENGTVRINEGPEEEMDIAAERFAREMMTR